MFKPFPGRHIGVSRSCINMVPYFHCCQFAKTYNLKKCLLYLYRITSQFLHLFHWMVWIHVLLYGIENDWSIRFSWHELLWQSLYPRWVSEIQTKPKKKSETLSEWRINKRHNLRTLPLQLLVEYSPPIPPAGGGGNGPHIERTALVVRKFENKPLTGTMPRSCFVGVAWYFSPLRGTSF